MAKESVEYYGELGIDGTCRCCHRQGKNLKIGYFWRCEKCGTFNAPYYPKEVVERIKKALSAEPSV